MLSLDLFLSGHQFGINASDSSRYRWRRLIEPGADLELTLVNLLDPLVFLVLGDLDQVVWSSIEKRDANISLLESADIVGTITGHEGRVPKVLQRGEDILFLNRRDSRVNPSVVNQGVNLRSIFVLLQSSASDADIEFLEDSRIERLGRIHVYSSGLVDVSPLKV